MLTATWNSMRNRVAITTCVALGFAAGGALGADPAPLSKEQIAVVWMLLERDARNSADAGFLLYTLYRESVDPCKEAWVKFGRGEQWLDWWLILRPEVPRPLGGDEYFSFLEWRDESEMHAVAERPEILERIVHARLYLLGLASDLKPGKEPITIEKIKEAWLDWKEFAYLDNQSIDETDFSQGYYDPDARRVSYWARHVNSLRWCYWVFGRGDQVTNVTQFTWKRDYLTFRKWITQNEPYLRFHEKDYRFALDQDAKNARRPVPPDARRIPCPTSPFPDWKGSPPTAFDYELATAIPPVPPIEKAK